jgi:hypothetical protein
MLRSKEECSTWLGAENFYLAPTSDKPSTGDGAARMNPFMRAQNAIIFHHARALPTCQ